jgi:hypothetical protein
MKNKKLLEQLAELEHQQWVHWTHYMLTHLTEANKLKWYNEIYIKYGDLTEKQKESDRIWARKVLAILYKSKK